MGYPTSVQSFTTKNAGDTIQPGHVNDLQTEVTAVETDLLAAWTSVSFSAGNFTAGGSQTWTVASGDQATFAYRKVGKTMTVVFKLDTTTVGGTPDPALLITIPGGFTAAKSIATTFWYADNGSQGVGLCSVTASSTFISLNKVDVSNWSASTNASYMYGQITFETTT